jgi:ABC-type histidine transport system ATPase subunit
VHKRFGAVEVLKGVSLTVGKGEVVAIIGPSGSGKSTFLRCLNHLETINRGRIDIEGETLVVGRTTASAAMPRRRSRRICRKMGMVFQHFNLFPHLTVLQNIIEAPITVKGLRRAAIVPKAESCCARSACSTRGRATRRAFPAARSSASRSPARWPWSRTSCSSTSRPRRSTRNSPAKCCARSASWPKNT